MGLSEHVTGRLAAADGCEIASGLNTVAVGFISLNTLLYRMLGDGDTAPDFELQGYADGTIDSYRLYDWIDAGNWVVLTFYTFDFNPICTEGACSLRDTAFFQFEDDLRLLGVSGDSVYAHQRFADQHHINYPLLADTDRTVGEQYGVVHDEPTEGMARAHQRSLFVIDSDRRIRLAVTVDADSPDDIDLAPLVDTIRELRA